MNPASLSSCCPEDNALVRFAHGRAAPGERTQLEAHLDGCSHCRQLVAAVANGSAPPRSEDRPLLRPGERLGRYVIERLLGAGGMGVVYVAHDPQLVRRVALKLMRPGFSDPAGTARLLREARAMARLAHPNVVNVFELGEVEGRVFVAMELVEGGTLRDWLQRPRTWREVLDLLVAAGGGLAAAHRAGVVHRDFKPENVVVGADGRPRVSDFGLARPAALPGGPELTVAGSLLGTPAYMSPEQLQGRPADARSDQYSFCVALHEALTGKRPSPSGAVEELRLLAREGPVPAHVWAALARGLQPSPARRFGDMEALLAALRAQPSPTRARLWRLEAAVAALVVALGVAWGTSLFRAPAAQVAGAAVRSEPAPPPEEPRAPRPVVVPPASTGRVRFAVNPWAEVFLEGRSLGVTPMRWQELPAGSHTFVFRNRELGVSRSVTAVVTPDQTTVLNVDLTGPLRPPDLRAPRKGEGLLTLVAEPFANVWLGERALGSTPLYKVGLPAGPQELRLVGADGRARHLRVTVVEGEHTLARTALRELEAE